MSTYYVAHCGGVMSENGYVPSASGNVANIVDVDGNFYPNAKNETDADAFIFEKDEDTNSVTLHVFKCNTSPKMICTYNDGDTDTKLLEHSSDIWKKHIIGVHGPDNIDYEVLADYNDFIGEDGIKTRGYVNPKKVEFSFINMEHRNDMKTVTTSGMFMGCTDLTSCEIPFQMRNIANDTFNGCTSLSSYTKNPDFIDTIGIRAFLYCESLPIIKIGKYTNLSGSSAFANCTSARAISWNNLASDERKTRMSSIPNSAFANCNMLTSTIFSDGVQNKIVIPYGITSIGNEAFYGCERASAITLNSVEEIGISAFENCYGLREVNGFSGVSSVGDSAFANAGGDEIYFDSDFSQLTEIGTEAFASCKFNNSLVINANSIGSDAFSNSTVDGSVTLNSCGDGIFAHSTINGGISAYTLCKDAFTGATISGSINLYGITVIPDECFDSANMSYDPDLSNIDEFKKYAFYNSNISTVTFKNGVMVGSQSFDNCNSLTSITFNGEATIGDFAFNDGVITDLYFKDSFTATSDSFSDAEITNLTLGSSIFSLSNANSCFTSATVSTVYINYYSNPILDLDSAFDTSASITFKLVNSGLISQYETYYQDYSNWRFVSQQLDYYLTFVALESGTFKFTNAANYSLDGGETWTALAANTNTPTVIAGQRILWKANITPQAYVGVGTFSNGTCDFDVEGNAMSLIYGDNFVGKTTFPNDEGFCGFYSLFNSNTHIVNGKNLCLPATTLTDYCYANMFGGCTSLTTAPSELPATTLETYCYVGMFYGCTSLTTAPELPATTLAVGCYSTMFRNCTSLTTAPELPATTLASNCYQSMFYGCTSLTTAPELPATTLIMGCYDHMFRDCTSLTTAPELDATTLATYCYEGMFEGCTSLTTAPELPAITLADYCYYYMFQGCTSLTTAPELPATTLANECYQYMFSGCTALTSITCLATNISARNCTNNWVSGVASSGTFTKAVSMNSWTSGVSGIPSNWTVEDASN